MKSITFLVFSIFSFGQLAIKFTDVNTKRRLDDIYFNQYPTSHCLQNFHIIGKQNFLYINSPKTDSSAYCISHYGSKSSCFLKEPSSNKDVLTIRIENPSSQELNSDMIDMKCPHYLLGNFSVNEFSTLDSINRKIVQKAWGHLEKIVSKKNLKKIYFSNGREVNFEIEKLSNPASGNQTKYYLCFGFSDKQKGIKNYGIYLELDSCGNLLNEINLPDCNENSKCFDFIELQTVKKSILARDFYIEKQTKIELEVNKELNIFCWKLINEKYNPNGVYIVDELIFNAHNGNFLKSEQIKGEWVE